MPDIKWTAGLILRIIFWVLVAVVLVLAMAKVGFKFDPLNLGEKKLEAAQTEAITATSNADARGLEAKGERASADRVDHYNHVVIDATAIGAAASSESWSATDAQTPLSPDRAARHHAVDQRLCELAPRSCAAAASADAGGGPEALPAGDPAAEPGSG